MGGSSGVGGISGRRPGGTQDQGVPAEAEPRSHPQNFGVYQQQIPGRNRLCARGLGVQGRGGGSPLPPAPQETGPIGTSRSCGVRPRTSQPRLPTARLAQTHGDWGCSLGLPPQRQTQRCHVASKATRGQQNKCQVPTERKPACPPKCHVATKTPRAHKKKRWVPSKRNTRCPPKETVGANQDDMWPTKETLGTHQYFRWQSIRQVPTKRNARWPSKHHVLTKTNAGCARRCQMDT